jgi:rhodanese-related sulfurtransferase
LQTASGAAKTDLAVDRESIIMDFMIQSLDARQAHERIARGELAIIDVREPREWSSGHLPGARLVPLDRIKASPSSELSGVPGEGVLFVCAVGVRSQTAAKLAEATGRTNLYNLSGGTRGWVSAGLPLVHD